MQKFLIVLFYFCTFLCTNTIRAEKLPDHLKIHADSTPKKIFNNHYKLTEYLVKSAKNDDEKVLIFSYWIAKNIKYDLFEIMRLGRNKLPRELLENRRGVCGCMSNLFQQMCDNSNVKCVTIHGKAYGNILQRIFSIYRMRHAWNMVLIHHEWKLIDVTWNTDVRSKKFKENLELKWVFMQPSEFAKTHFPYNPAFQLLTGPYTKKEFNRRNIPVEKNYYFEDTLKIFKDSSLTIANFHSLKNIYNSNHKTRDFTKYGVHLGWRTMFDAKSNEEKEDGIQVLNLMKEFIENENYFYPKYKYLHRINYALKYSKVEFYN